MNKVEAIKQWALENYASSWGASTLIECFTDEELDAEFESFDAAKQWAGAESKAEECRREPWAELEERWIEDAAMERAGYSA